MQSWRFNEYLLRSMLTHVNWCSDHYGDGCRHFLTMVKSAILSSWLRLPCIQLMCMLVFPCLSCLPDGCLSVKILELLSAFPNHPLQFLSHFPSVAIHKFNKDSAEAHQSILNQPILLRLVCSSHFENQHIPCIVKSDILLPRKLSGVELSARLKLIRLVLLYFAWLCTPVLVIGYATVCIWWPFPHQLYSFFRLKICWKEDGNRSCEISLISFGLNAVVSLVMMEMDGLFSDVCGVASVIDEPFCTILNAYWMTQCSIIVVFVVIGTAWEKSMAFLKV